MGKKEPQAPETALNSQFTLYPSKLTLLLHLAELSDPWRRDCGENLAQHCDARRYRPLM